MKIIEVQQGSDEWKAVRAKHFTASEAPAMMGVSKFMSRSELLRQKATGYVPEVDPARQALFDKGHAAEAAARPIIVTQIGDDLFPVSGTLEVDDLPLFASFDGLTMTGNISWEHKLFNNGLAAAIERKEIDQHYWAQLEHQLLVSGADRVFFSTGTTDGNNLVGMWYASVPERRAAIIAGWKQFRTDLAAYQHVDEAVPPTAAAIESLPALLVQVEGRVLATNLDQFKQKALAFIEGIKTDLSTDQDFADADKMTKFLKDGEERLELVKSQTLAQTSSIDELFRTIDTLREEMRAKRLTLEKTVDAKKKSIRAQIQADGEAAARAHIDALNKRLGRPYMPDQKWTDFVAVMKGKKTIASLRDAVNTELARFKIAANEVADRIQTNMASLVALASDYKSLFADAAQLVLKSNDDMVAVIKTRIAEHKADEEAKAERERAAREQEAKPAAIPTPIEQAPVPAKSRPTDNEIIEVLALHYRVHEGVIIGWLCDLGLATVSKRMLEE